MFYLQSKLFYRLIYHIIAMLVKVALYIVVASPQGVNFLAGFTFGGIVSSASNVNEGVFELIVKLAVKISHGAVVLFDVQFVATVLSKLVVLK